MIDLGVQLHASCRLQNPVGVASGTFGYGSEYEDLIPLDSLGAVFTKAVTREPRPGNGIPRIVETPGGLLNSIGLANVGQEEFALHKFPMLKKSRSSVFINVAGSTEDDYAATVEYLEEHAPLAGYEINVSCPNVHCGGMAFGTDPAMVAKLATTLRALTKRVLIFKLSPNVTDIAEIARSAEANGADAVSCINTVVGMLIDTRKKCPVLPMGTGGLSGPAILPVGLAAVWRVSKAVKIPVIGIGGIHQPDHAIQYLLAGASAVQTGTVNFVDPAMPSKIIDGIRDYMEQNGISRVSEFRSVLDSYR